MKDAYSLYGCIFQKDKEKSQEWFGVLRYTKKRKKQTEAKLGKKDNFLSNHKKDEFQQTDKMLSFAYNFWS